MFEGSCSEQMDQHKKHVLLPNVFVFTCAPLVLCWQVSEASTAVRTLTSAQTRVTFTTAMGLTKGAGTGMAALTVSVRRAISTTKMACVLVSITDTGCSATLMTQLTCIGVTDAGSSATLMTQVTCVGKCY